MSSPFSFRTMGRQLFISSIRSRLTASTVHSPQFSDKNRRGGLLYPVVEGYNEWRAETISHENETERRIVTFYGICDEERAREYVALKNSIA